MLAGKIIMRLSVITAALLLAACSAQTPAQKADAAGAGEAAAQEATAAAEPSVRVMEVGPKAASLAYEVSQHSPLLTDAQRAAISQDFNGAPLSTEPQVHTVTADSVSCRARTESVGEGAVCAIDYGEAQRDLSGQDAQSLFDALASAGVEPESDMSHLIRAITDLACTIDDGVAQGTSSTGSEINGFACRFSVSA